jgi:hypothetical protein
MTTAKSLAELQADLVELTAERDALRAQLDGDLPAATRWLQRKVVAGSCAGRAQPTRRQPALRAPDAGRPWQVADGGGIPVGQGKDPRQGSADPDRGSGRCLRLRSWRSRPDREGGNSGIMR